MANGMPPARVIRSASDEATPKPESRKPNTITSASDEGMPKASRHTLTRPQEPFPSPVAGTAPQGSRDAATRTVARAGEVGGALASNYGAACSELVTLMQGAARRQGEFMNDMLHARSPVDVMFAGNRYLLGGLQAFFDGSVRIAQATSHRAEESHQHRDRHAA